MHTTDRAIIQRVLAGEQRAYAELVDRHKDKAMTLALRMLRNREDAEEALQDAFVRAFHALPRFEWKASFSTWLYRIVYNVCATALSTRNKERTRSLDEEDERARMDVASEDPIPDMELEAAELDRVVARELRIMPEPYGSMLTLFLVQDMSYEEIVHVTGAPLGTVKARLFRARAMLRNAVARALGPAVVVSDPKENIA